MLLVQEHAEREDLLSRLAAQHLARHGHPAGGRQRNVEHDEIGLRGLDDGVRFLGMAGLTRDHQVRLAGNQGAKALAEEPMVVDEDEPDGHGQMHLVR